MARGPRKVALKRSASIEELATVRPADPLATMHGPG